MKKIAILGSDSFIAKSIFPLLGNKYAIHLLSHSYLDLKNLEELTEILKFGKFDAVINTATRGGKRYVHDTQDVFYDNILMTHNLLTLKGLYGTLIMFGSGAEHRTFNISGSNPEFYGFSKYINTNLVRGREDIVNLRLFNVFGPLEENSRFIKTCVTNYINKEPIEIWEDKCFDFFYYKDLFEVINFFIERPSKRYQEIDCIYPEKVLLSEVAGIVNDLSDYKVPVNIERKSHNNYCGDPKGIRLLNLKFTGLRNGIKEMYEDIRKS